MIHDYCRLAVPEPSIKYVLFDDMVELCLKIMQSGRLAFKAHSRIQKSLLSPTI